MDMKTLKTLVIGTQIISIGATAVILAMGLCLNMTGKELESVSGTISSVFILIGVSYICNLAKPLPVQNSLP